MFMGCRGVVERCVVEVALVLRVQRLVLRVRRGTEGYGVGMEQFR